MSCAFLSIIWYSKYSHSWLKHNRKYSEKLLYLLDSFETIVPCVRISIFIPLSGGKNKYLVDANCHRSVTMIGIDKK